MTIDVPAPGGETEDDASQDDLLEQVRAGFVGRFGVPPEGIWSAPGRVNLLGEHVDYHAGLCAPMAISERTYAAVRRVPGEETTICSAQSSKSFTGRIVDVTPADAGGWSGYVLGVLWALREFGLPSSAALEIFIDGRVPLGAGLSSSAALECSVAVAAREIYDLSLNDRDLVTACVTAENDFVGAATGGLDQSAAIFARSGHALLLDMRSGAVSELPWDLSRDDLALLVIDTRARHSHMDGGYGTRRQESEEGARVLGVRNLREIDPDGLGAALAGIADDVVRRRVRHVVTEIARVGRFGELLADGRVRPHLRAIGELFDASHESLRSDYEASSPELDVAVTAARKAGAHGARMTGGGFGGSAIALVESSAVVEVTAGIEAAFAEQGFAAPSIFPALPGPGARRER